jgi:hypothetical protein
MSTTSNLSRFASRRSVANFSIAQKQIAPTTMMVKIDIKSKTIAISYRRACAEFNWQTVGINKPNSNWLDANLFRP